jgi:16S rRNA C1402 N4-methylase RsmH
MRMDDRQELSAKVVVNEYSEMDLFYITTTRGLKIGWRTAII